MLNIQPFICNNIQENCYVVSDETRECVIIDCGAQYPAEQEAIKRYIADNQLKPVRLLATHGHADHNIGNRFVFDTYGLKVELGGRDEQLMQQLSEQVQHILHQTLTDDDLAPVGRYLTPADTITFGSHTLTIIPTPGHTPGSVFYYNKEENIAFSGDTLFRGSIGRTDLPGGSMFMIIQSLRMICQLPDETRVYPGHGPATTIGDEVATNPYLDR